ncbi:hypothetical protein FB451DRAFT_1359802 [Mycena latifolia]|nr:hypothetical protein FB451DRAFT_1359802 [Mycena latifolia]
MPPRLPPVPPAYRRWFEGTPTVLLADDPIAWNQAWERYLARPRPQGASEQYIRSMSPATATDELLSYYRGSHRDLCENQYQLSMTQCNISAHYEFERTWTEWPVQKRKDVVQDAIRVFTSFPIFQNQRQECCEISITFLEPRILELLKHFVLDDMAQIPADPIIYPVRVCALNDANFNPGEKLMLRYVRLMQTLLLCSVLGQVLTIFLGDPPLATKAPLRGNFKIKTDDAAEKKMYKAMAAACERCRKKETNKIKMQICDNATATAVVNSPDAEVHTVSVAQEDALSAILPTRVCSIRPCVSGYKRSPALLRQVILLQQNPAVDYYFCLPREKDNLLSIAFPVPADTARFCAARDGVMSTGSFASFRELFRMLEGTLGFFENYSEADLLLQLNKEYGFGTTANDPRLRDVTL